MYQYIIKSICSIFKLCIPIIFNGKKKYFLCGSFIVVFGAIGGTNLVGTLAQASTFDITMSEDGKVTGGEKIGELSINTSNNVIKVSANLSNSPSIEKVYEGWLVDEGGTAYNLSLGKFDDNSLVFEQNMVNPYTYSQFVVTEEPENDPDPNAAAAFGGVDLHTPFGQ